MRPGSIRSGGRGILALAVASVLIFYLIQAVQSLGINPSEGGQGPDQQNPFLGGGAFGRQGLLTLQIDVQLTEDSPPSLTPLSSQLVEIFWESFNIPAGETRTLSVSGRTDDRGRALFRLSPGNYTIRVDYQGIDANETVIIPADVRIYAIEWVLSKTTLSSYRLEFRDTRGDGVVLAGETVIMIYERETLVADPRVVELRVNIAEGGTRKVSSLDVVGFINFEGSSIVELTPVEPFIVSNFNPENPPEAAVYSIRVDV